MARPVKSPSQKRRRLPTLLAGVGASLVALALVVTVPVPRFDATDAASRLTLDGEPVGSVHEAPTLGAHAGIVRPVAVHTVRGEDVEEIRLLPGTVQPARASHLAFRVGGPLITLSVGEGDLVEAGDLLAEIDPRDYRFDAERLHADIRAAQADSRLAQIDYDRAAALLARGASPQAAVDRAAAQRDRAEAHAASLHQQLAVAEAALADTQLIAPFDGRVARLHVEAFDYVRAREPAITLHDTAGAELEVFVPERLIARLDDLSRIEIELSDLAGRPFPAAIREIASDQEDDAGSYRTTLRAVERGGPAPLAGLSGIGRFIFTTRADRTTLTVPTSAIFVDRDGTNSVWIIEPGRPARVRARPVTLDGFAGDRARVVAGLIPGDRIVAYGADFLVDGQGVRPVADGPMRISGAMP